MLKFVVVKLDYTALKNLNEDKHWQSKTEEFESFESAVLFLSQTIIQIFSSEYNSCDYLAIVFQGAKCPPPGRFCYIWYIPVKFNWD